MVATVLPITFIAHKAINKWETRITLSEEAELIVRKQYSTGLFFFFFFSFLRKKNMRDGFLDFCIFS
jgi:hypothetical protein